jgi:hypothetical protein
MLEGPAFLFTTDDGDTKRVEITGRDRFIIGLALAYAKTMMEAVACHNRCPQSDLADIDTLLANGYDPSEQLGFHLQAYSTATGCPSPWLAERI